jgi:hypothetical protein
MYISWKEPNECVPHLGFSISVEKLRPPAVNREGFSSCTLMGIKKFYTVRVSYFTMSQSTTDPGLAVLLAPVMSDQPSVRTLALPSRL